MTTSSIEAITNQGRLLTLLNQREIGARRGLIISGAAATGKTTAIKQLGRFHELRTRARFPGDDSRIPVVYVTAPPKGSPRKLAMEFARFLGLPTINPRMNVTDISDAVCQVMIDARTDIVVVDEIHNLNLDTRAGEELSDHLKYFTEHLPATFVYAGIEVEKSGLFTGTRGRQLAGRCGVIHTNPFPDAKEWRQLVAAMEGTLRLHRHKPGTLVAEARYLHLRTRGMIGNSWTRCSSTTPRTPPPPAPPADMVPVRAFPQGPQRPLPKTVAPFRDETVLSYVARLAHANHLATAQLRRYVAGTAHSHARPQWLAVAAGPSRVGAAGTAAGVRSHRTHLSEPDHQFPAPVSTVHGSARRSRTRLLHVGTAHHRMPAPPAVDRTARAQPGRPDKPAPPSRRARRSPCPRPASTSIRRPRDPVHPASGPPFPELLGQRRTISH